jgi:hypothetical protein
MALFLRYRIIRSSAAAPPQQGEPRDQKKRNRLQTAQGD